MGLRQGLQRLNLCFGLTVEGGKLLGLSSEIFTNRRCRLGKGTSSSLYSEQRQRERGERKRVEKSE